MTDQAQEFLEHLRSRHLSWPDDFKVQRLELEDYIDPNGDLGAKVWALLEDGVQPDAVDFLRTLPAQMEMALRAQDFGFDGFTVLVPAFADEEDRMPSRRGAAA